MIEKRKKTATLAIRVLPELKKIAEQAAKDDNRSITQFIETLLIKYLKENGYFENKK